jgi:hypothetical protein
MKDHDVNRLNCILECNGKKMAADEELPEAWGEIVLRLLLVLSSPVCLTGSTGSRETKVQREGRHFEVPAIAAEVTITSRFISAIT